MCFLTQFKKRQKKVWNFFREPYKVVLKKKVSNSRENLGIIIKETGQAIY